MNHPNHWNTEELYQATQLRAKGKTYREIAAILGRSKTAIRVKLKRVLTLPGGGIINPAWVNSPYEVHTSDCKPINVGPTFVDSAEIGGVENLDVKSYSTKYSAVKMREYRAKYPEKFREYMRSYRKKYPEKYRLWDAKSRMKRRYGITLATLDRLWKTQKSKCACCGRKMKRGGQKSISGCVDHNHKTGVVRAILCTGCNVAIAHLNEDPGCCELAAAYLRKHNI